MNDSLFLVDGIAPPKTGPIQSPPNKPTAPSGSQFGKILRAEKQAKPAKEVAATKEENRPDKPEPKNSPVAVAPVKESVPGTPAVAPPVPIVVVPVQAVTETSPENNGDDPAAVSSGNEVAAAVPVDGNNVKQVLPNTIDLGSAGDEAQSITPAETQAEQAPPVTADKSSFQVQLGASIDKSSLPDLADTSIDPAVAQKLQNLVKPAVVSAPSNPSGSQDLSSGTNSKSSSDTDPSAKTQDVSASAKNDVQAPASKTATPAPIASGLEKTVVTEGSKGIESARLAEARTSEVMKQVLQGLDLMVKNKNMTMKLQLYPEDLGHIELRVVSNQNGLGVFLKADQPSTQQLLESQAAQLKQSLTSAGVNPSQIDFGQGNKNRFYQPKDSWHTGKNASMGLNQDDGSGQAAIEIPLLGMNSSKNGVDYKV